MSKVFRTSFLLVSAAILLGPSVSSGAINAATNSSVASNSNVTSTTVLLGGAKGELIIDADHWNQACTTGQVLSSDTAHAGQSHAMEMLVLKGEENPNQVISSESRRAAAQYLEKKRKEMRENGYLEVDLGGYSQEAEILSKEDKLTTNLVTITNLRFEPLDVAGGPLSASTYLGAYDPLEGLQEGSHNVVQLLDHPSLGRISIEEYSYTTDTEKTRYAISAPPNNVSVVGYPAGYVVLRVADDLSIGKSQIWFVTDEKHIKVSAYKPIEQNSSDFGTLRAIASYLAAQ